MVVKVDGWIVGEDGIRGMKGKLIDKLGRLIATTGAVSFAAALGERVTRRGNGLNVTNSDGVTVTGNDLDVATTSALTDSANRLGTILLERYEKLVPVVEFESGRVAAAIFSNVAEIAIYDGEDSEAIYRTTSASLD